MLLACAVAAAQPADYRLVVDPAESAQPAARELLQLLARGDIEAAAQRSNAPERRLEVLRDYRDAVGEAEFKRVYARFLAPANRVLAEAAVGSRRLVIWDLSAAGNRLAGQFFVEADGRFLLDDVPSAERQRLERVLADYRRKLAP